MRPQAGVGKLKHAPPMQANDLPVVGHALACRLPILSHLLRERFSDTLANFRNGVLSATTEARGRFRSALSRETRLGLELAFTGGRNGCCIAASHRYGRQV